MTLQERLTSVFQSIGLDIKSIWLSISTLNSSVATLQGQVGQSLINEHENINTTNPISDQQYLNIKTTGRGEVRHYNLGFPIQTQTNEVSLEINTSVGLKKIKLK